MTCPPRGRIGARTRSRKKLENHAATVALYFMHYNFARIHRTLRITPAMAAGVSDHVWGLEEIIGLLDAADKKSGLIRVGSSK